MIDDNLQILYCRINLTKTNYSQLDSAKPIVQPDLNELRKIFKKLSPKIISEIDLSLDSLKRLEKPQVNVKNPNVKKNKYD